VPPQPRPGPRSGGRFSPNCPTGCVAVANWIDVDPGRHPGETTITFQYFAIPAVTNEAGSAHDGTTTLATQPTEKFVFGRQVGRP
jgi:hypothetical protein